MSTICDELEVWEQTYKPINRPSDDDDGESWIFETYGDDYLFVSFMHMVYPKKVWTWVDGDDGTYLINGLHLVNRIGYLITGVSWLDEMVVPYEKFE